MDKIARRSSLHAFLPLELRSISIETWTEREPPAKPPNPDFLLSARVPMNPNAWSGRDYRLQENITTSGRHKFVPLPRISHQNRANPIRVSLMKVIPMEKTHSDHVEELHHDVSQSKGWLTWRVAANILVVGFSWGLYGYDSSFVSPVLSLPLFIQKYQDHGTAFTATNLNLLVSVPLIGAAIGSFASIWMQSRMGRKRSLLSAYIFCCVPGSILQLFAPDMAAMVCGRIWNNMGISMLNTISGLYLSEMVPSHARARAIASALIGSSAVSVIAATVVWATEKINDNRQYTIPFTIQVVVPATLAVLTLFVTESPTWLALRGRMDDARCALKTIRNNNMDLIEAEMRALLALVENAKAREDVHFWDILSKPNIKRTLIAGASLSVSQVGGQILVLLYSTVMLVQSGVEDPFLITVIIYLAYFLGGCVGPILLDKVGRRPTALGGFTILFLLDIAIAGLASSGLTTDSERLGLASLFIIFGFFNALVFQSLLLLLPAELPSARLREATASWSMFWSYVTAIVTTFVIPHITEHIGAQADFVFAGCMLIIILGTYLYLPETKDRTLAEIEEMYTTKVAAWKWKGHKCSILQEVQAPSGESA
ncbi:uncharacterized protein Z518_07042 [Rhinocladiella mackenziei CBS 650.93]|uniref:Major facilitator superfamily (MFS) profile domain-containing protein n=1 Tax=Rhinocladiella mackenziei CBS 650.93 TaxID=1442369 RepID=A0A0D2ICF5_9EURO|nr:uncharacterized protein Z518_07042 [Rhinocladiella mackenziei CBS 650.93]KIX03489.1 hypothetical protein Z518_07042 [Rhinocladiella mackenziei CBS 650.93]